MFLVLNSTSDYKAEAFGVPLWLTGAEGKTDTPTNTKEHNDSAVLTTIFESDRYLHPGLWCLYYIKNTATVAMTVICSSALLLTASSPEWLQVPAAEIRC
jgi:hypothetical protein